MTSVAPAAERIYLGMDVSKDKIAVRCWARGGCPGGRGDQPRRGDDVAADRQVR